jgi:hypothetical protein
MPSRSAAPALGAVVLALLAAPGLAEAAALDPLKPCYVSVTSRADGKTLIEREKVDVSGTGYTPGALVDVTVEGKVVRSGVTTDAAGNLPLQVVDSPYRGGPPRPFTVTAAEQGNPASSATLTAEATALNVGIQPSSARPSQRVAFRGRGFTGTGKVYAHYLYGGKVRRTVTLATPQGACGTFTVRRRQIPVRRARIGKWTLRVDQQKRYSPNPASVWVSIPITVERRLRLPR